MENSSSLANRFREVMLNGTWVAYTNYKDQLSKITWEEAIQKVGSLNTIAALTFHINYYIAGVLNVFEGGKLEIRDKYSFDCPEIKSHQDWQRLHDSIISNSEKFATHLENLSNKQLSAPFVEEKYGTYDRNMNGMIEHCYYHLGQVSLISKMIKEQNSKN